MPNVCNYAVYNFTEAFKENLLRLDFGTRCSLKISTRLRLSIFLCDAGVAVLLKENARRVKIRKNKGEREMTAQIRAREIFHAQQSVENVLQNGRIIRNLDFRRV